MEKGEMENEKLVFFLHYHLNAYYVAQIIFIFFNDYYFIWA
jgi:hypothetical protein